MSLKNLQIYDKISYKILKVSSPLISISLNRICNKLLSTGMFLTRINYTEIKPLYKKINKNNIVNNRPSKSYCTMEM
jgi:hypothetical protein